MKAEHRKELETNTLAEGMGRVIGRMKGRPRRGIVVYVVGGLLALLVFYLAVNYYQQGREENAENWLRFYDGNNEWINELSKDPTTSVGRAALLERTGIYFWEEGLFKLGRQQNVALSNLSQIGEAYANAAQLSAGDATFEAEALFGRAVVEETRAVQDRAKLKSAQKLYESLTTDEKYKNTAYGKQAAARLKVLSDPKGYAELAAFYTQLQEKLHIPNQLAPELPPGHPPVVAPKKGGDRPAPAPAKEEKKETPSSK